MAADEVLQDEARQAAARQGKLTALEAAAVGLPHGKGWSAHLSPDNNRVAPLTRPRPSNPIPCPFLEPSARSWSHFVGIYRQKLSKSSKMDF